MASIEIGFAYIVPSVFSFIAEVLVVILTVVFRFTTPSHLFLCSFCVFNMIGGIFLAISPAAGVCQLSFIGQSFFLVAAWMSQCSLAINLFISIQYPSLNKTVKSRIWKTLFVSVFLYPLLMTTIIGAGNFVEYDVENGAGQLCYDVNPTFMRAFNFIIPFGLCLTAAIAAFVVVVRFFQTSTASNQKSKKKLLFYGSLSLLMGLWRIPSLPFQFYLSTGINPPPISEVFHAVFVSSEGVMVFLAICWNYSILARVKACCCCQPYTSSMTSSLRSPKRTPNSGQELRTVSNEELSLDSDDSISNSSLVDLP